MTAQGAPHRRTQAQRRSKSEEALLAAAAELIAERGIDGASLAGIGARAGASRGLPIHHFGSKDALIARLAGRAQDGIYEELAAAAERLRESLDDIPVLDFIRMSVDTYLELFEHPTPELRALIVMWGATFPSESSIEGMDNAERRSYQGWEELVTAGQLDGSVRQDLDPGAVAVLLQGTIRGIVALLLTDSALNDMSRVREASDAWIMAALAPSAAAPRLRRSVTTARRRATRVPLRARSQSPPPS